MIIGNSAAAVGAVEGIRRTNVRTDSGREILLISDEPRHTYSRPLISYWLQGKVTEEKMRYRGLDFYDKNGCILLPPKKAVRLDADRKKVFLAGGRELDYDRLLIATGSSALVPPIPGLETVEHAFTFMSMDDAVALRKILTAETRALIVGAGLIGLKCAEGIRESVRSVQVVDLAPQILSSVLDETSAKMMQDHLEKKGILFDLSNSVDRFDQNRAFLRDKTQIEFDALVLAAGVKPSADLVKNAGGRVGRGIVVNDKMETSLPGVYAAGDCTESLDVSSGEIKVMALLPNAYMQGECAGVNMAGGTASFTQAVPMNAIGFFGMHALTAGVYTGETYVDQDQEHYKKLFYGGNHLNGVILINREEKAGVYTSLIRERTPLDTLDFDLLCRQPGLAAFAQTGRDAILGGVL
jgi:NAD(P)H-nitrite reductase large subunit